MWFFSLVPEGRIIQGALLKALPPAEPVAHGMAILAATHLCLGKHEEREVYQRPAGPGRARAVVLDGWLLLALGLLWEVDRNLRFFR